MPITVVCGCGRLLSARDDQAGRSCKCPGCGAIVRVPAARPNAAPDPLAELARAARQASPAAPPPLPTGPPPPIAPPMMMPPSLPAAGTRGGKPPRPISTRFYWLLLLLVIPLAWDTFAGSRSMEDRIDATIEQHPELEKKFDAVDAGDADLDEVVDALPDHRLVGALLPRGSWAHWAYAAISSVMFFGVILLALPLTNHPDDPLDPDAEVTPKALVLAGLFTGSLGVFMLIVLQVAGIFCCVLGAFYLAALHPDAPFGASLLGFVLGVGLCEEIIKAIPVLWRMYRGGPLSWRSACLIGMASGAGFGVSEGIHYCSNYYNGLAGGSEYVLRFTSVAALHVLLSGACGILLQRHRPALDEGKGPGDWIITVIAIILVPMFLHGLYDTLLKKEFIVPALIVWTACFAWLAWLIETSRRRDRQHVTAIAARPRLVRTARGMRWVQESEG